MLKARGNPSDRAKHAMTEPDNLVLVLLRDIRREMTENMATKADIAELRSEMHSDVNSLRADVASDMMSLEKRLSEQISGLRKAVMEYHSSIVGHGTLISELEERMRRVERHLDLPPLKTH